MLLNTTPVHTELKRVPGIFEVFTCQKYKLHYCKINFPFSLYEYIITLTSKNIQQAPKAKAHLGLSKTSNESKVATHQIFLVDTA